MIPRHRPPFSLREFLSAQLKQAPKSLQELEEEIGEQLNIPYAVVLPSARFGIFAGLKIMVPAGETVGVPVSNCSAVHEAAVRSGRNVRLIDGGNDSFLLDLEHMPKCSAWVLSELYGQTYDLPPQSPARPACILDMAMTIPEKCLLERMGPDDLGLFSFGIGKAFFAGWGGVAVTRDAALAQEIRLMVRNACGAESRGTYATRSALIIGATGARVVAHWRHFYGIARKIQNVRQHPTGEEPTKTFPSDWFRDQTQGQEWRRLPLAPETKMIAHNFRHAKTRIFSARELESQYRSALGGLTGFALPPISAGVLSHFTIRVPASRRGQIRRRLWSNGIDTGDLFGFPGYCDPARFPNAFKTSHELINLPMDPRLTAKDFRAVAAVLTEELGREQDFARNQQT